MASERLVNQTLKALGHKVREPVLPDVSQAFGTQMVGSWVNYQPTGQPLEVQELTLPKEADDIPPSERRPGVTGDEPETIDIQLPPGFSSEGPVIKPISGPEPPELPETADASRFDREWNSSPSRPEVLPHVLVGHQQREPPLQLPEVPDASRPGHGSFQFHDPHGDVNHARELPNENLAGQQVVDAIMDAHQQAQRMVRSTNEKTLDSVEQLAKDSANDYRRMNDFTASFEMRRETITDVNI